MRQTASLFCLCYLWFCSEKSFLQLTLPLLQPVLTSVSLCHLECIHPVPLVAIVSTCGSAACTATSGPEHAPTVHRDRLLATMHVLSFTCCHRVSDGCLNSPALIIAASPRLSAPPFQSRDTEADVVKAVLAIDRLCVPRKCRWQRGARLPHPHHDTLPLSAQRTHRTTAPRRAGRERLGCTKSKKECLREGSPSLLLLCATHF